MRDQSYSNKYIKPVIVQKFQSGQRLDQYLSKLLHRYSRSQIKRWICSGKVTINSKISVFPKKKVIAGECIEIIHVNKDDIFNNIIFPQNIPLDIIYEDNDIIVINKSSNMVVYPGAGNNQDTILNALLYRYPYMNKISKHAGIVQRLDKDTTGLMVIAKNVLAYENLLKAFKERKVIKQYEAIVWGKFAHSYGIIEKPIRRNFVRRTCMTVHALGKLAITRYFVVETFNFHSRVRIQLETGRTHQIRVHMRYINHPLVGDQKYGKSTSFIKSASSILNNYLIYFRRQALHSCRLKLLHPITQIKMEWKIPLPQDIIDLINLLKNETYII